MKLKEIAELFSGKILGDPDTEIDDIRPIARAGKGHITFFLGKRFKNAIRGCKASAVIMKKDDLPENYNFVPVITDNPYLAFQKVMTLFHPPKPVSSSISKNCIIKDGTSIEENVSIGDFSIIGERSSIGRGTSIGNFVSIEENVTIGKNCIIHSGAKIYPSVKIGSGCIIHSGAVIGGDGFGYARDGAINKKIPHIGGVIIGDDVEIGANCTIDAGTFDPTIIENGVKIDNLVHIAHNVFVGENSIIVAQVGIAGSVTLEKNVTLAGQVGIAGHLTIGENSIVAAQSGVSKSIPPNSYYFGYPAKPANQVKREMATISQLPELIKKLKELLKKEGLYD